MKYLLYKNLPTFWYLVIFIYTRFSLVHKTEVGF